MNPEHPQQAHNMSTPSRTFKTALRILAAVVLVAVVGFSMFGFLAAFAPGNGWGWQAAYGTLACACLCGVFALVWPRGRSLGVQRPAHYYKTLTKM
jgi:hypothetical protein